MPETIRQQEAFKFYYSLYPRRSYAEVARKYSVSETIVGRWAKKYHWEQRLIAQMEEDEKAWRINIAKSRALSDEENLKLVRVMKSRGLDALTNESPLTRMNNKDGADVVDKAVKLEREILGQKVADNGQPVQIQTQNNLTVILQEVLKNGDKETIIQALKDEIKDRQRKRIKGSSIPK